MSWFDTNRTRLLSSGSDMHALFFLGYLLHSVRDLSSHQGLANARHAYEAEANAPIIKVCTDIEDAISEDFVVKTGFKGAAMAHSRGVSIYFPLRGISHLYAKIDFTRKTSRDELLKIFQVSPVRRQETGGQNGL